MQKLIYGSVCANSERQILRASTEQGNRIINGSFGLFAELCKARYLREAAAQSVQPAWVG